MQKAVLALFRRHFIRVARFADATRDAYLLGRDVRDGRNRPVGFLVIGSASGSQNGKARW